MDVGKKIADLRMERNWSQTDLAAALHESRQSVSRWESGREIPELDRLIHLSLLFEIPLEELQEDACSRDCESEKKRKEIQLIILKGFAVGLMLLLAGMINLVWLRFLLRLAG